MPLILILTANFFICILCLIAAQSCYFGRRWKWFFLTTALILVSASVIAVEIFPWLFPATQDQPLSIRFPTTPL